MILLPYSLLARRADPPRLLIAPLAPAKKDGPAPSPALGNHIAQEFDGDGRVGSVVWGLSDPIFRPLALDGKLGDVPVLPSRAQALEVAHRMGAGYVLLYRSERKNGKMDASAELVENGRTVWRDAKNMNAQRGGSQSDDDTAASVARTWVVLLTTKDGPLRGLAPQHASSTPVPTKGQAPIVVAPPPALPATNRPEELQARIDALVKAGDPRAARFLARDAVDANPMSPEARRALVRLLAAQGDAAGAAEEARRAADLMPDQPALRIDAIRRLLATGRTKEASDEANELRARMPDDKGARLLTAEVALVRDDAPTAVREAEAVLKAGDDAQAHLLRGVGRARLGGSDGAVADLKAWAEATPAGPVREAGYAFAERTLGAMASRAADGLLPLLQRAAAQPKSGAVRDDLDEAQRQAQARVAAFAALPADGAVKRHDDWVLAHRLMALVAADLRAFLAGGGEDALTSARIDLGEARQAMKTAEIG